MKRKTMLISSLGAIVLGGLFLSMKTMNSGTYGTFNSAKFHAMLNSGGASAGNAGAPGENNCTACHAGSVAAGAGFNVLEWADGITTYTPGETYSLQLSMEDASAKNGFQLVALKASDDTQAGTMVITDEVRTQLLNGAAGKRYVGHRAAGNTASQWTFNWTAPSENVGDVVFYVATNKTNSNGQTSGDLVRLSQHTFNAPAGSGASLTAYESILASLKIALNNENKLIDIKFVTDESESLYINVMNLQGQSVLAHSLGSAYPGENHKEVRLNENLSNGVYIVNFFVGNKAYSQKVML